MRAWGIGIGLVVIALLIWVAFFWNRPSPVPETNPTAQVGSPLIDLEQVKSLELANAKGRFKFERDGQGYWEITEPEKDDPDPLFFGGMIDVLSQLTRLSMVGPADPKLLPQYGLEPAFATIIFEFQDGAKKVLRVGRPNPAMSALYAWYEDEPEVFLIKPKVRMFLAYSFADFRYRRLIGINAQSATGFKVVILDPELREFLGVPEVRELARQTMALGSAWILLDSSGNKIDNGHVEEILNWMQKVAVADEAITLSRKELKDWGLEPPQAYFEIAYPDRIEKVLIGNMRHGLIALMQPGAHKILAYKGNQILSYLASDYQSHRLLAVDDQFRLDRIELSYADGKTLELKKLDRNFWTIAGGPERKFGALKITWLTEPFIMSDYQNYIRERPVPWVQYGLKPARLKLKFFAGADLLAEVWIGKWDPATRKNYVYLPERNLMTWYELDLMNGIPPGPEAFLSGEPKY